MVEIIYNPQDVGKYVTNSRGKLSRVRKFHNTPEEMKHFRERWKEDIKEVPVSIVKKAGSNFFNPFRKGIYYGEIQALFLLGCAPEGQGEWFNFPTFMDKLQDYLSSLPSRKKHLECRNYWDEFRGKKERPGAVRCKDYIGRIQENMLFFQRLTQLSPYGYKLRQVGAAVDIMRKTEIGCPGGMYYYRLSVYKNVKEAWPLRDFSGFVFPRHERKYISYKFIGKVVTKDRIIFQGVDQNEMSEL